MPKETLRTHGEPPFKVAVIHGGPGASGEMAPVARELTSGWGVLEPPQTAASLQGQVDQLSSVSEQQGQTPVTLIGFSWGAWLSFIVAAHYPALVQKLILIGSGSFEESFAEGIRETRLGRLSEEEKNGFFSRTCGRDCVAAISQVYDIERVRRTYRIGIRTLS